MATFYIEAIGSTSIALVKVGSPTVGTAKYGVNNSSVPNSYTYGDSISLQAGQKCYWTITSTSEDFSYENYLNFTSTGGINVGGNLSDLIGGENAVPRNWCFRGLFSNCRGLVNASNLVLISDFSNKTYCCHRMFQGCPSLRTAPAFPATILADYCYSYMFQGCSSLTAAPELPATTLANYCYQYMFDQCSSFITAPELPAVMLAQGCYQSMFQGCSSLTTAPELPATTLAERCYQSMFQGCISLTTAPELPVATLAKNCYHSMFSSCASLTTAPELPATTLASDCYANMFFSCSSLTTAPELPATTLAERCYQSMFQWCTSLTATPELPATTLVYSCYSYMFQGCTSLTAAPGLPATILADYCYANMFENCTSLKLSTTQTGLYRVPYQIPTSGTGVTASNALNYMFSGTGGTFIGTPEINTTYYLWDYSKDVQLYDSDIKLYPVTRAKNVDGLAEAIQAELPENIGDMQSSVYDPSGAVAEVGIPSYVDSHGGKIDTIKLNGTTLPIEDKTVNITVPSTYVQETEPVGAPQGSLWVWTPVPKTYGVTWDGTADPKTSFTRIGDAADFGDCVPYVSGMVAEECYSPFDEIMPWAGMEVVEDADAGTLVAIPKFYYKLEKNTENAGMTIQISTDQLEGFVCSPAHMDRGDGEGERDVVYVGRYHCATSTYKSTTNVMPQVSVTRANFRSSIHNLGTNIYQLDLATRFTIWLLYLVEFANFDSQTAIGGGCSPSSSKDNMGKTDSMPYHTGTTAASRGTPGSPVYGWTQYRNIEGLWDNVYDWLDGCYNNSNGLNVILNPDSFSDSTGGTLVGKPTNGYPSAFSVSTSGGFPMFYPTTASGSASTFSCDYWYFSASDPCLCAGGYYYRGAYLGLFYVYYGSASFARDDLGARLMKLP